jgi:hypothetical protein
VTRRNGAPTRAAVLDATGMSEASALGYLRANRAILARDERVLVRDIAHLNAQLERTRQRRVEVDHGIEILEDR